MRTRDTDNRVMLLAGVGLLGLAVFVIAYYAVTVPVEKTFGERYVNAQVPVIFPFYVLTSFKPVTLLTYLIFGGVVLVLEASKDRLRRLDTRGARLLLLFGAFAAGYEVIWNFYAWFATWQRTGGLLDLIANTQHEYAQLPWNFNFATKISFLVFALSLYGGLFLQHLERESSQTRSA